MITRACISINNRCNLSCAYCHFHEPQKQPYLAEADMDVFEILDNIKEHVEKYDIPTFKLGFVGNGEPLMDHESLRRYIEYIGSELLEGRIAAYTITNGTLMTEEMLEFFKTYNVNVGFSLDGPAEIHDKWRGKTHALVMEKLEEFRRINGHYPSINCTVGRDVLKKAEETIEFFERLESRITFSRMIGKSGISLEEYRRFLHMAEGRLNVRRGGMDCTMYGGQCGAGLDNIFYANGKVYICGNCVDLPYTCSAHTKLEEIFFDVGSFDRNHCFRESLGDISEVTR